MALGKLSESAMLAPLFQLASQYAAWLFALLAALRPGLPRPLSVERDALAHRAAVRRPRTSLRPSASSSPCAAPTARCTRASARTACRITPTTRSSSASAAPTMRPSPRSSACNANFPSAASACCCAPKSWAATARSAPWCRCCATPHTTTSLSTTVTSASPPITFAASSLPCTIPRSDWSPPSTARAPVAAWPPHRGRHHCHRLRRRSPLRHAAGRRPALRPRLHVGLPARGRQSIGGLEALVDHLADDHELGKMIAARPATAAFSADVVVETFLPGYGWRADVSASAALGAHRARPAQARLHWRADDLCAALGVAGRALRFGRRVVSSSAGRRRCGALRFGRPARRAHPHDRHALRDLWLVPLRDVIGLAIWFASFAGNTILWRGERFHLKDGRLTKI